MNPLNAFVFSMAFNNNYKSNSRLTGNKFVLTQPKPIQTESTRPKPIKTKPIKTKSKRNDHKYWFCLS